ncbi:hypothetical protein F4556_005717 [Kitasatospora gansuensis]|uniref:Uncharacterized protein n=1 Tax=Kitasatospora gansuensis TaxID=258050 RepID=A0A7W7SHJ3_9ACTN|nr:hypothetical protein [Kitasatospora gansuensis]MBB4950182.1 hypothetical protein [Kitasatospora gansuensis]
MTAPGAYTPQPGRASITGRPVAALFVLLLAGLLAVLPCAGRAHAVARTAVPAPLTTVTAQPAAVGTAAAHGLVHHRSQQGQGAERLPLIWCTVDGERPDPGSGCSSHPYCGQESQLPNAPPQPVPAVPARLIPPQALPAPPVLAPLSGPDLAPDLHALQVLLS